MPFPISKFAITREGGVVPDYSYAGMGKEGFAQFVKKAHEWDPVGGLAALGALAATAVTFGGASPLVAAAVGAGVKASSKLVTGDILGAVGAVAPVLQPQLTALVPESIQQAIAPFVPSAQLAARGDFVGAALSAAKESGLEKTLVAALPSVQLPQLGGQMPFSISDFTSAVKQGAAAVGRFASEALSTFGGPGTFPSAENVVRALPSVAPSLDTARRFLQKGAQAGFPGELGGPGILSTSQPFSFTAPVRRPSSVAPFSLYQRLGETVAGGIQSLLPGQALGGQGLVGGTGMPSQLACPTSPAAAAAAMQKAILQHAHMTVPGIRLREIGHLVAKFGLQAIASFLQITIDEALFIFMRWTRRRFRHHRRGVSWRQISNARRTMHLLGSMSRSFHGGGGYRRRSHRSFRR